jgi:membrane protease subunit (stomatin/prohibitin family)
METVKSAAESLGKSGGGGAGLGTGMVLIPQIMNQPSQTQGAPAVALVICPKCGSKVLATSKFCPECGTNLSPPSTATIKCPKCGKEIPADSKFCPECGNKISE